MGVFDSVKSIAERTTDTIPEIKQTVTHLDELILTIKRFMPLIVVCLCVIALTAVGTMAGVVVLLVR